jgi:guanine deaminase
MIGSPMRADDERWLSRAVALATANVAEGGGPFGAVVVRDGIEIANGQNRVTRDVDPTAHAEVMAIRAACRALGSFSLHGCSVFSSCEPCLLCAAATLWARADRLVYAADRRDAERAGFDDRRFDELIGADPATWPTPMYRCPIDDAAVPMDLWLARSDRVQY